MKIFKKQMKIFKKFRRIKFCFLCFILLTLITQILDFLYLNSFGYHFLRLEVQNYFLQSNGFSYCFENEFNISKNSISPLIKPLLENTFEGWIIEEGNPKIFKRNNIEYFQAGPQISSRLSQAIPLSSFSKTGNEFNFFFLKMKMLPPNPDTPSQCGIKPSESMCSVSFTDSLFFGVDFYNSNQQKLGSVRSVNSDVARDYSIFSFVPSQASFMKVWISNIHRAEHQRTGLVTDVNLHLWHDPDFLSNQKLKLIKEPMLRNPSETSVVNKKKAKDFYFSFSD